MQFILVNLRQLKQERFFNFVCVIVLFVKFLIFARNIHGLLSKILYVRDIFPHLGDAKDLGVLVQPHILLMVELSPAQQKVLVPRGPVGNIEAELRPVAVYSQWFC
jgi:hypothetical protein